MDYTKASGYMTDAQGRRQFIDRNDAEGVQGTYITQADLNAPQNEIVGAIKKFGLTPSDESDEQLSLAMASSSALSTWSQDVVDAIGGYPKDAIITDANGKQWKSLVAANKDKPGASASWMDASAGRLLGVQRFAVSGTYTPNAGVQSIIVEVQGGGGSGFGCSAQKDSGTCSIGAGGNAGTYAKGLIKAPTVTTITVGAQTANGADGASYDGNASSFGALIVCPGGAGGSGIDWITPFWATGNHSRKFPQIDASVVTLEVKGDDVGGQSFVPNTNMYFGGAGACSRFGSGGGHAATTAKGDDGTGPGAGGSGCMSNEQSGAVLAGKGASGIVIVWEYS